MPSEKEKYIKAPHELIDLCKAVVEAVKDQKADGNLNQLEIQLEEVSAAIHRMEKKGVAIPHSMREEKINLSTVLSNQIEADKALVVLQNGFRTIIDSCEVKQVSMKNSSPQQSARNRKGKLETTHPRVLRKYLLKALTKLGGKASSKEVIQEMEVMLKGKLLPDDMVWRKATYGYAWQNSAKWERFNLTKEGILRSDSQRGIWELSEDLK